MRSNLRLKSIGMFLCRAIDQGITQGRCPIWVKLRRTQYEQVFSAVAPTTDIVVRVDELTAIVNRL
jgi:hypothetical protein